MERRPPSTVLPWGSALRVTVFVRYGYASAPERSFEAMEFQRVPYRYERPPGHEIRIIRWDNRVWELHSPKDFGTVARRIMQNADMIRVGEDWTLKSKIPLQIKQAFIFDVPEECLGYYRDLNRVR